MEKVALLQEMVAIAGTLKGSKLKGLSKIEASIERVRERIGLTSREEVMTLVAMFDRQCSEEATTLGDLSSYLRCSSLEVMVFAPAVSSLSSEGYIHAESASERDLKKKKFQLFANVFNAIVEGGEICPTPADERERFDQFVFCDTVHDMVEERSDEQITTKELFARVLQLEDEHPEVTMIKTMKEEFSDVTTRLWFYDMCRDFSLFYNGGSTNLNDTLQDIYDNISQGIIVKKEIIEGSHPLVKADLMYRVDDDHLHLSNKGITLLYGEECATAFVKSQKCEDKYEFINNVCSLTTEVNRFADSLRFSRLYRDVERSEMSNNHLPFVANTQKYVSDAPARLLFYNVCWEALDSDTFNVNYLSRIYTQNKTIKIKHMLKEKKHILQKEGLVELKEGNFLESSSLELTDKGKELFFEEDIDIFDNKANEKDVIDNTKIAEKRLFFEPSLQKQLSILQDSLQEKNLLAMRQRLKENKLPLGIAALLYGQPGTGKTESVMQMARATGRSIVHVDISEVKTCWFGESQKLIKGIFTKYRKLCEKSKVTPILLFNEADAVLSKRKDSNFSSVAQEENAIQNIILEEMERLDGILIATTNMATNLDQAFERRFLFKVRFDKPTIESKKHIWMDKLPSLSDTDASLLATTYDFSGGEIDNIVRKATIEEVVSGTAPTMERLTTICREEKISSSNNYRKMGF